MNTAACPSDLRPVFLDSGSPLRYGRNDDVFGMSRCAASGSRRSGRSPRAARCIEGEHPPPVIPGPPAGRNPEPMNTAACPSDLRPVFLDSGSPLRYGRNDDVFDMSRCAASGSRQSGRSPRAARCIEGERPPPVIPGPPAGRNPEPMNTPPAQVTSGRCSWIPALRCATAGMTTFLVRRGARRAGRGNLADHRPRRGVLRGSAHPCHSGAAREAEPGTHEHRRLPK